MYFIISTAGDVFSVSGLGRYSVINKAVLWWCFQFGADGRDIRLETPPAGPVNVSHGDDM